MSTTADLTALGVDLSNDTAVLAYIAKLPITRTERIRLLRNLESERTKFFDPHQFAQAVEGIPPA